MAVSNWSIRLLVSAWWACIAAISCSMEGVWSPSMADECRVSGGEEGVLDRELVNNTGLGSLTGQAAGGYRYGYGF